ncbi:ATP-dependent DNA helicase [Parasphingorhabdus cellanae]|uniref:ATP-dependent DNA helicase n=1 Tax=Parasphingorhabdus cellanae TaxID=2806553 RepID=A0ABX7T899_9SPHN|nr:ATP-dependent DNA helicase [Parasphingorhabdus cellanae]QTD57844.1 ATP-dependent DNA helicase [Parasphingorhabdus cellanae]
MLTDSTLPYPALHASHSGIWICGSDGVSRAIGKGEAIGCVAETPHILLNAPLMGQRLGYPDLSGLDLLELFAFIHPAQFVVPTPAGLAKTLGLEPAGQEADIAKLYRLAADHLLAGLQAPHWPEREGAWSSAQAMYRMRWPWAAEVSKRLTKPAEAERWLFSKLEEWEEETPRPAPRAVTMDESATLAQLNSLTGKGSEEREGQKSYASAVAKIFEPRRVKGAPNMLLAEAGTGIGKTLGYLAPASLWSAEAGGAVWISTFTKALQRQLDRETRRIYPDEEIFRKKVVVRKGRENYLCLLNLEDALQGGFAGRAAILAHLVARWAAYSKDGDMVGGDLPGWLTTLFRRNGATALTDRRGECVYAGCPHYRKCFIEKAARASQQADIVIANHALVMVNAARGREQQNAPTRLIFDEGHHLFDAADSMFAARLSGQEAIEIRRWVIGPESKNRGRRRGLAARLADLASYDDEGGRAIESARHAAEALPSDGWLQRLSESEPFGPVEALLGEVRHMVFARDESQSADAGYGLETELTDVEGPMIDAVANAAEAIDALLKPLVRLGQRIEHLIEEGPDWMDAPARARMEGALSSLGWRCDTLSGWLALLSRIGGPADPDFVDWLMIDRFEGREYDIGICRHWLDPTIPVTEVVMKPAHGLMITSATLKGGGDWETARARSGAVHLDQTVQEFEVPSPFNYADQAKVIIVTDVKRGDMAGLAGAYAQLIEASGGGTLGLFTAIRRLRTVYARIADRMAQSGLPIYAQHVDPIDTGTLVDIFRDDPKASLLGTDALRDGVDVPGRSLRLVVMESVPWPRPDILHKARRIAGGGTAYDDRIIRARLAQAFGRIIRRADDHGHFVILSSAFPSRLLTAFPEGTPIERMPLAQALAEIKAAKSKTGQSSLSPDISFGHDAPQRDKTDDKSGGI